MEKNDEVCPYVPHFGKQKSQNHFIHCFENIRKNSEKKKILLEKSVTKETIRI